MITTENLTTTQANMIAASLEHDGRTDIATSAVIPGHITEFNYINGRPYSAKAKELESLKSELDKCVARFGLEAVINMLRQY